MKLKVACLTTILALLLTAPALAEVTTNIQVPLDMYVFVPCVPEMIHITGELHILLTVTVTPNTLHFTSHFQPMGVSGVGLTTGDKYQGTGVTRQSVNVNGVVYPYNYTYVNNFRMIGQGPGNNFMVHQNVHLTINANGEVTAQVDNLKITCK